MFRRSPPTRQFTVYAERVTYRHAGPVVVPVVVTVLAHDFEDAAVRVRSDHEDGDGFNILRNTRVYSVRRDR